MKAIDKHLAQAISEIKNTKLSEMMASLHGLRIEVVEDGEVTALKMGAVKKRYEPLVAHYHEVIEKLNLSRTLNMQSIEVLIEFALLIDKTQLPFYTEMTVGAGLKKIDGVEVVQ